jgi:hypothetical protein
VQVTAGMNGDVLATPENCKEYLDYNCTYDVHPSHLALWVSKDRLVLRDHSTYFRKPPKISDTGRIYIKGYVYPILYPKISKKDISYLFLEQDIFMHFKISYPYPILYPFFSVQCPRFWVSEAIFFL